MEFTKAAMGDSGYSSYMEFVSEAPQKPEFTVVHVFQSKVADVMASLEWHAEARELPDSCTYWLSCTALLQDKADEYIKENRTATGFEALKWSEGTVVVLDSKASLMCRSLPMLEIYHTIKQKKLLDLACPSGALATMRPFKDGWEFGNFDCQISQKVLEFDISKIEGKIIENTNHAEMAKCAIAGVAYEEGVNAPTDSQGYIWFTHRLRSRAIGPLLRDVAYEGRTKEAQQVITEIGLNDNHVNLNSMCFCGHSVETCLHAAAAGGHVYIVQLLLLEKMDVNVQDGDGETPLHYAAFAGQTTVVKVLLSQHADPLVESFFGETPEDIAKEGPACFLDLVQWASADDVGEALKEHRLRNRVLDLERESRELRSKEDDTKENLSEKMVLQAFEAVDTQATGRISQETIEMVLSRLLNARGGSLSCGHPKMSCLYERFLVPGDNTVDYRRFVHWLCTSELKA
jgi:hypothetical protein